MKFFDNMVTGNDIFKGYNLVGVPSFLIVDRTGKYVGRIRGYNEPLEFITQLNYFLGLDE